MEVGAVKLAFNNELIMLKKKLNQAKIQIIHKLTRKAKTLTEKKAPEPLKDKFKRKAESAVKEVLIIKKIKIRDVGQFMMTHTSELQKYLNKPEIDLEKACARLLLHKVMQDKYKSMRTRFSGVPIKDLLMSREEKKKLKKEERDKKKLKQKKKEEKKNKVVNAEGDWNVEEIGINASKVDDDFEEIETNANKVDDDVESQESSDNEMGKQSEDEDVENSDNEDELQEDKESQSEDEADEGENSEGENSVESVDQNSNNGSDDNIPNKEIGDQSNKISKKENDIPLSKSNIKSVKNENLSKLPIAVVEALIRPNVVKKVQQKVKDNNKNKNLKEKILKKKFKKDSDDAPISQNKIADPFFITSTGENYMSVAEQRPPDEFKEIHRQGNRQMRRAAMFGHEPRIKPKRANFEQSNRFDKQNSSGNGRNGFKNPSDNRKSTVNDRNSFKFNDKNPKSNKTSNFNDRDPKGNSKGLKFNDKTANFVDKSSKFSNRNKFNDSTKDEKLHPSWEAKKRQSGILPFQGKKIVFDES